MKKIKSIFRLFTFLLVILLSNIVAISQSFLLPKPERGFYSTKPATTWENGLASGNGKLGALVFGQPIDETIVVSSSDLLMPLNKPLNPVNTAPYLSEIRNLLANKEYQKAADLVINISKNEGYGGKRWTDPPIPAFNIKLEMPANGAIAHYQRSVDFSTGVTTVNWSDDNSAYERKLFVSRADNLIALSIRSSNKGKTNCTLKLAPQSPTKANGWNPEGMYKDGFKSMKADAEGNWLTFQGRFSRSWEGSLQGYEGVSRIVVTGGESRTVNGQVIVKNADAVLVLTRLNNSYNVENNQLTVQKEALTKVEPDFESLLQRHSKLHKAIYNRVKLHLDGNEDYTTTSEELMRKSAFGKLNPALLQKVFDAARYNILSSSGEQFPLLQGVWTGTYGPWWSGSYTLNGNVQVAMAANLSSNMAECMMPYFDFVEAHMDQLRLNAQRLYGCRGICFPSVASNHMLNNHFDNNWCMTFWTAGAGWASHFYYDYWLYTGNREFLLRRAYPFMKENALFYEDFLKKGTDGKLLFSPSYSPENTPSNSTSQACINASMDIGVARELLNNCIKVANYLQTDTEKVRLWKQMLADMPPYQINDKGAVKEWATPLLTDNETHRHCSHLYALYYGIPDEMANDTALIGAFDKALQVKLNLRRREFRGESVNGRPPGEMAFGIVLQAFIAASLRKADDCAELLDWLANQYWGTNYMSTHNPRNIFNTDLSGGLPEILIRMLVHSREGQIDLLPAWSQKMPNGKIEGVCLRDQIQMKELRWNKKQISVVFLSPKNTRVKITTPSTIATVNGKNVSGDLMVNIPKNKDTKLEIILK